MTYESRVFVYGEPNKGRVLESIRQQVPNHWAYKFERDQFMNPENWTPGDHDGVPCTWVNLKYERGEATYPVFPQEGVALLDKALPVKVKE